MDTWGSTVADRSPWRRGLVLAGLVLAGAAASIGSPGAASATPGTCTRYWTGVTSTAWETATNWSTSNNGPAGTVPGAVDVACMSTSPARQAVQVNDARSVAGVSFADTATVHPTLTVVSGANLTVGGVAPHSYDSVVRALTIQSGGTLSGTAPVSSTTVADLAGATLQGTGSLTVTGTGSVSSASFANLSDGYQLRNSGAFTSTNGILRIYSGTVTNTGTWTIKNTSNDPFADWTGTNPSGVVNAVGATMNITPDLATDTTTLSSIAIKNNGTLAVTRGTLATNVGGSGSGTYTLAAGTSLNLNGGSFDWSGASLGGAGTVRINSSGAATGSPTALARLELNGGSFVGGGSVVLPSASTTTLTSGYALSLVDGTDLVSNGTVTSNDAIVRFYNGAELTNNGTWTVKNASNYPFYDWSGTGNKLTNATAGTLAISPANAADVTPFGGIGLTNNGVLKVTKGSLGVASDVTGTGSVQIQSGAQVLLNGGVLDTTTATVTGAGTLTLNNGGALKGSAGPTSIVFNGGSLVGGGTTTIPAGTTATVNTGYSLSLVDGTDLVNNGTVVSNDGIVRFYNGAVLTNNATYTIKNPSNYPFFDWSGVGNALVNGAGGTMAVSPSGAGDVTPFGGIGLTNNGAVNVTKGKLAVTVNTNGSGSWNVAAGTSIDLTGGVFDVSTGSVTGAGTLNLENGGQYVGSPGPANLAFNGGSIGGGGTSTIASSTAVTVKTGYSLSLVDGTDLVNNGTVVSNDGIVRLYGGSVLTNNGTWTLVNPSNSPFFDWSGTGNKAVNGSSGVLNVLPPSTADTTTFGGIALQNDGTLNVTKGRLSLTLGGSGSGTYALSNATTTTVDGGTLDLTDADVTGAGTLVLNSGGTITGTGTVASKLSFGSFGSLAGTGTLTLAPSAVATMTSGNGVYLRDTYRLLNQGTFNQAELFRLTDDPRIENAGTWNLTYAGDPFTLWSGGVKKPFVNSGSGLLTSAPGAGNTTTLASTELTNAGELRALSGTTHVSLTNLNSGGTMTGGTIATKGGALGLNANLVTNSGTVVQENGAINTTGSGTSALPSLRTNTGTLALSQSLTGTGAVTNSGTVWVKGGTFRPTTYTQTDGTTRIDAPGVLRGGAGGSGAVTISAGTLYGGGTVQGPLTNAGRVIPGGPGTPLAVTGTYTQPTGGTFQASVSGATTVGTDYTQLSASGAASLSGTLAVSTLAGYDPAVGTSVRILNAASRTGTFGAVTGRETLPAGKYWGVAYDATGVSLVVKADPVVNAVSGSINEGDTGAANYVFTVYLSQASERTVTVGYATANGTATAPSDFTAATGTLTFAPGELSRSVLVPVLGDTVFEPNETFTLQLSAPTNATLGSDGTATILNDDPEPPRVAVSAVSPGEIGQGASEVVLTVSGSGFDAGATVTFGKAGITKVPGTETYVDEHTLRVAVNTTTSLAVGPTDVTVTGAAGTATCTGCLVVNARPTISTVSPLSLGAGAQEREVLVTGTGFKPGARVTMSGGVTVSSTSYVDATTLEALVSVPASKAAGGVTVSVVNPDRGRNQCACFATVGGPKVTGVSPATWTRSSRISVTVTGTGFGPGAKVIAPAGVVVESVVRVSDTTLTATVSVSATAKLGANQALVVVNSGSAGYGRGTFKGVTITNPPPS